MKNVVVLCTALAIALTFNLPTAEAKSKYETKRNKVDAIAKNALDTIVGRRDKARQLYDQAYGYAVFDNLKVAMGISGGGGRGVAVDKASGRRVYMDMGTGGLNLGLGVQKYQVIFLFED